MSISEKDKIKERLYHNYFTKLHSSEKGLKYTSTKITNKETLQYFKKNRKKHILDAGCGDGLFIEAALQEKIDCEGFDCNEELLALCRKKGYEVKYGDLSEKLPYKDNTFDGVFCSNVMEHLKDPDFAMAELFRILKKDGILMITVPEYDRLFWDDWTHIRPFTEQTLDHMAMCFDIKEHRIYRRHFPFLVARWENPIVRMLNAIFKKGPLARLATFACERFLKIRRHDLVFIMRK